MKKSNKFVVLTMPRSGSNMLMQTLDSHPQIKCYGELFRQSINSQKIASSKGGGAAVKIIRQLQEEFWDPDYRYDNALEFLENIVSLSDSSSHVGFKLMLGNKSAALTKKLVEKEDYKVILLKRSNMIAVYSSNEIAKATGQGAARKNDIVKSAKVEFEAKSFENFSQRRFRQYEKLESLLADSNKSFFEIEYNQIRNDQGLKQIIDFLGVDQEQELKIPTKKRNSDNILDRFSNPEIVKTYIEEKGLQEWTCETPQVLVTA